MRRRLTEAFGQPNPLRRTGVVTLDPMKHFEIKVTKVQNGDRPMRVFANNAAALEWVTADEPGNPSAVGGPGTANLPWWFDRRSTTVVGAH